MVIWYETKGWTFEQKEGSRGASAHSLGMHIRLLVNKLSVGFLSMNSGTNSVRLTGRNH